VSWHALCSQLRSGTTGGVAVAAWGHKIQNELTVFLQRWWDLVAHRGQKKLRAFSTGKFHGCKQLHAAVRVVQLVQAEEADAQGAEVGGVVALLGKAGGGLKA
jgi:hypothetical protein